MFQRFGAACCWFVLLLTALPAQASRMAVVVRGEGTGADKAAAFVSYYVHEQLGADDRYDVVDFVSVLGAPDQKRARRALNTSADQFQAGRDAYEDLDLRKAVEALKGVIAKHERHAAYVTDMAPIANTLMLLGATQILMGKERKGARYLSQALTILPEVEPDPRVFNPSMRRVFQRVSDRVSRRPQGTLNVTSNPSHAAVSLDGRFVGVTPMVIEGVSQGRHYLRFTKDGYRNWGKVVDVVGGSEVKVTAGLKMTTHYEDYEALSTRAVRQVAAIQKGRRDAKLDESVDELGVLTNADYVFVAEVTLDGDRVRVRATQFDLNAQKVQNSAEQVFSFDERPSLYQREVRDLLTSHFDADTLRKTMAEGPSTAGVAPDIMEVETEFEESGGFFDWGFEWTPPNVALAVGVGSGIALGAVGGTMWALAQRDNNDFASAIQVSSQASSLRSGGRSKALAGDIMIGMAGVAIATGVGMWLWWDPNAPDEPDVADEPAQGPADEGEAGTGADGEKLEGDAAKKPGAPSAAPKGPATGTDKGKSKGKGNDKANKIKANGAATPTVGGGVSTPKGNGNGGDKATRKPEGPLARAWKRRHGDGPLRYRGPMAREGFGVTGMPMPGGGGLLAVWNF